MSNPYTELKNIKYNNMLLSKNKEKTYTQNTIDEFLNKEKNNNKTVPWNKLDKTEKLKKLQDFSDVLVNEHKLNISEKPSVILYLKNCLERKRFERVKDINYDKEKQEIESIPNLTFNKSTQKFVLKRSEKRVSTLKSLGPGRKKKGKTQKIQIVDDK